MRRAIVALAVLAAPTLGAYPACAEPRRASAAEVKAAFVFNIAKFSRWPDPPLAGFNICTLGDNDVVSALHRTLNGKSLGDLPVSVVGAESKPEMCRVLFVTDDMLDRYTLWAEQDHALATLSIGEHPRFFDRGGMIKLIVRDDRVRFQINANALADSALSLSSQLWQLAESVTR